MENYYVSEFLGYQNKRDITNLPPGVLISGSRNVVSTDGDTIAIRQGYELFGTQNDATTPILSSFEWQKLRKGLIALRSYDDELEFYWSSELGGDNDWYRVTDGTNTPRISFTTFFSTTEQDDQLLFVDGDNTINMWSGGIATFASATATTITLEGSTTWSAEGFLVNGTRAIRVLDDTGTWREATYTGGESTDTLTGLSDDLTAYTISPGQPVIQAVRVTANQPASSLPFTNDIIRTFRNQVIIGSYNDQTLYISAVNDFSDYTPSSPRLHGEGASLTLDAPPVDIVIPNNGEEAQQFYVTAGNDFWFTIRFVLSSDLQNESVEIEPLKTSTGQAANNQGAVGLIKNYVAFVSKEPTFDFLGRVEDVDTTQSRPISDVIKTDFDSYDFTDCHVKYFRNNVYIALPQESLLLCYNISKSFWEAPWDLPAGRIAVIGDDLVLHSNSTPTSFRLFTGYNDAGNPINAVARFSYQNYGERMKYKNYTMAMAEGYITSSTVLNVTVLQDFDGAGGQPTFTVNGTESNIFFSVTTGSALGKNALGKKKLSGEATDDTKKKFRKYKKNIKNNFFEASWQFSSNDVDQQWEIISFGGDTTLSSDYPIRYIK